MYAPSEFQVTFLGGEYGCFLKLLSSCKYFLDLKSLAAYMCWDSLIELYFLFASNKAIKINWQRALELFDNNNIISSNLMTHIFILYSID